MNDTEHDAQTQEYLDEIDALQQLVESGEAMVKSGQTVNLSNLEGAIADLCRRMAAEPPAGTGLITVAIEQLVERLGALGDALRRQAEQR